jgi:RNA polymerase sigma factor (sigma-70 family)
MISLALNGELQLADPTSLRCRVGWLAVHSQESDRERMELARNESSEAQEIRASLSGDGDAYEQLVRRHQGEIARYMRRFDRREEVCAELVQDVFVQAYFSLATFRWRAPFLHWLRRIATRVGYRYWKERKARASVFRLEDHERALNASEHASPQEAAEFLDRLLGRLPPRDRVVLTLFYLEELAVGEICDLTGWTKTTVKVRLHRARAKIRALLEVERK